MRSLKLKKNKLNSIFITGTDTGTGKTVITGLLARYLLEAGFDVVTQKWIQTGCEGFSEDIEVHHKLMGHVPGVSGDVCPYIFELPASPHLAARCGGKRIDARRIVKSFNSLSGKFDSVLVEGVGGVLVPYNGKSLVIELVIKMKIPVLIVAGNKLGAINHTLLTVEALRGRGADIIGIVFNYMSKKADAITEDNPKIVAKLTGEKIFGALPFVKNANRLYKEFAPIGEKILAGLRKKR